MAFSCGGGVGQTLPVTPPTASSVTGGVHQCKVGTDTARPMLVEWPATEKAALQASSQDSVVVVSYDGCRLKLMEACRLKGDYEFRETSRSKDGFTIKDKGELFAKLPLGAVSLEGEIQKGNELNLSYVAVGTRTSPLNSVELDALEGSCAGATHFVRTMVVGAYELATEASLAVGASVEVGPAGLGGGREASTQIIRSDGDMALCSDRSTPADDPACRAVVQLVLVPLVMATPPPAPAPAPVVAVAPAPAPAPEAKPKPSKKPEVVEAEPISKGGSGDFELIYHESYCAGNVQTIPFTDVDPVAKKMLKMVRNKSYCSTKGPFVRKFKDHAAATKWVDKQNWSDFDDDKEDDW